MIFYIKDILNFRNDSDVSMSIGSVGLILFFLGLANLIILILAPRVFEEMGSIVVAMGWTSIFCLCLGVFLLLIYAGIQDRDEPGNNYPTLNKILVSFARWWRKYIMKNKDAEI